MKQFIEIEIMIKKHERDFPLFVKSGSTAISERVSSAASHTAGTSARV